MGGEPHEGDPILAIVAHLTHAIDACSPPPPTSASASAILSNHQAGNKQEARKYLKPIESNRGFARAEVGPHTQVERVWNQSCTKGFCSLPSTLHLQDALPDVWRG